MQTGTFSTESFHSDGDVGGRRRLGRGRRCSRQNINLSHSSFSDGILSSSLNMNKFKTCREILLLSYADNNISDEEFVPLYDCYRSKNPDFGYQSYDVFDLENMNLADCKAEFRVEKADLPRLADALHISVVFHCKQRSICDGLEGLCVLLRRTSYSSYY